MKIERYDMIVQAAFTPRAMAGGFIGSNRGGKERFKAYCI